MYHLTPYPITPIGSFFGLLLALLPLAARMKPKNPAIWMYSFWVALMNLQLFVNTIVWHNNYNITIPVWCDISIRFQVVAPIGIRACTLILGIQLFKASRFKDATFKESLWMNILSISLMLGVPLVIMALYIIVQPVRFDILEEIGCIPAMVTYVTYIITTVPELVLSIATAALIPFTLPVLRQMNSTKKKLFQSTGQNAGTTGNFKRQMVIVCLDTLFNLPILIFELVEDIAAGKANSTNRPYESWNDVHHGGAGTLPAELGLDTILLEPASHWSKNKWSVLSVKWDEWIYVVYAIVFFGVFGTTSEMKDVVRKCARAVSQRFGFGPRDVLDPGPGQGGQLKNLTFTTPASRTRAVRRRDSESLWSDGSEDLSFSNQEAPLATEIADDSPRCEAYELGRLSQGSSDVHRPTSVSSALVAAAIPLGEEPLPEQGGKEIV